MMQLGIFDKTFSRPTLDQTLDAVVSYGLQATQFNFSAANLPDLPDAIESTTALAIRQTYTAHQLTMAAVSGTFNMIHPDPAVRQDGLQRLEVIAAMCQTIGTSVITLCTGTRNPDDMWSAHPDNDSPAAWRDLLTSMEAALKLADTYQVTLAIEPEPNNVINRAVKARQLLDELRSPQLKIVMDAANLLHAGELPQMTSLFTEAFDLLGNDIVLAHAKDVIDHDGIHYVAAGKGSLDYDLYLNLLRKVGYDGALVLHTVDEPEVESSLAFVRGKLAVI
jgi:sugar phosphate isomerase/epimerase